MSRGLLPTLGTDLQQTGGEEATPPADEPRPPADEPSGGEEGGGGDEEASPPDAPPWTGNEDGIWWDPESGQLLEIIEGFGTLGLKASASQAKRDFLMSTLKERGYATLFTFGGLPPSPVFDFAIAYSIQLPPGVTFAEAYESLMSEFGELISFLDPWTLDHLEYPCI